MNGIDKITGKIAGDAQQEIKEILAKAKAEAATIIEKYTAQADAEQCRVIAAGEDQAKEIQRRAKSVAELEARQQLLATKQKMISQAFEVALTRLLTLPDKEYTALLASLAAQASTTGYEEVVLSPKDHKAFGQKVVIEANQLLAAKNQQAALTLSEETRPIVGGILLKAGDIEVNSTLDSIVRLSKDNLALDVAAALFA